MQDETANRPETAPAVQTAADLARPIEEALDSGDRTRVQELARDISVPDLADVIELLDPTRACG